MFCLFQGLIAGEHIPESGAALAMRALGWGTLYAVTGVGLICFGIWKLSGAKSVRFLFIYLSSVSSYLLLRTRWFSISSVHFMSNRMCSRV